MRVEDVIQINAPIEAVWAVTADVERWPEWTPTMESVERIDEETFDVGSAAYIKQPGLPGSKWVVTEMKQGKHFTWESNVRGLHLKATHELSSRDSAKRGDAPHTDT